ncbi:MAG: 1-acyl-sn-glycerol-3-phosphate acyltransferase [Phycisphaerae bacterium]|nr:1-acyl-sn-glycerol-3-phosphate acyltransferase [Phycisphaerae bacterium]
MANLTYTFSKNLGLFISKAYFRLKLIDKHNVPSDGAVLLVTNHQSYMDPLFMGSGIKRACHFMARESLFRNKFFGRYIRKINAFPVKRDSGDVKAIKEIIKRLNDGNMVNIFPEGTRTLTGKIKEFKSGLELITRRSGATLVPVLIEGAYEAWPKKQLLPWPKKVYVQYAEPITPEQLKNMGKNELAPLLTKTLRDMQTELRTKIGKEPYDYSHE